MTFDERLKEALMEFEQSYSDAFTEPEDGIDWDRAERARFEAITAIKQAMRETMPEKINNYNDSHAEAFVRGYNTAIDEIEAILGKE